MRTVRYSYYIFLLKCRPTSRVIDVGFSGFDFVIVIVSFVLSAFKTILVQARYIVQS